MNDEKQTLPATSRPFAIKVGVILNFKRARLEWERLILDPARARSHKPSAPDANEPV